MLYVYTFCMEFKLGCQDGNNTQNIEFFVLSLILVYFLFRFFIKFPSYFKTDLTYIYNGF